MKIIVGAVMSRYPYLPGSVWNRLHRVIGLQRLGHEVYVVEELAPERCVDRAGRQCDFAQCVNRELFAATMCRFGLMERACQIYNCGEDTFGLSLGSLAAVARDADLLINVSGHMATEAVLHTVKRRVYVDEDPVYTQLWHAQYGIDLNFQMHDALFSVGLNIGTAHSPIPTCGVRWHHLLPPVILDYWPFRIDPSCRRFSTIASLSSFEDLCYRGERYRSKAEEFKRFAALPRKITQEIEVALKPDPNHANTIRRLRENHWIVTEANQIDSLSRYQNFIARSRAELGIGQNAYVKAHSGWFSDRSAHYLASGKPVLVQSTGIERWLPTGQGLVTFKNMEEAVAGIEAINSKYTAHCRAAREFAAEYLDYRKVLPKFLEECSC